MVFEGLKLTILGMSVVFIFLVILVFIIKLNSKLCAKSTSRELDALNREPIAPQPSSDGNLVAVISAAIKKFKTK
ncbi:MAG: OadG family protein [Bacteriovoracaceae bacterium]|nr:OadG family protein [Bacteriovoracaceae bacterium]